MTIYDFHKDGYDWLSNFYRAEFVWDGIIWPTSEHAYQAAKCADRQVRLNISRLPFPGEAKKYGQLVPIDPDWSSKKIPMMKEILTCKFRQNPDLKEKLLATGNTRIEEGNTWNDTFWGVCPPGSENGLNHLGELLMELREELRGE